MRAFSALLSALGALLTLVLGGGALLRARPARVLFEATPEWNANSGYLPVVMWHGAQRSDASGAAHGSARVAEAIRQRVGRGVFFFFLFTKRADNGLCGGDGSPTRAMRCVERDASRATGSRLSGVCERRGDLSCCSLLVVAFLVACPLLALPSPSHVFPLRPVSSRNG